MKIKVYKNKIRIIENLTLNDGEYKVNKCVFEFTSEYDGLTKKAVFSNGYDNPYKVVINNNECEIPAEVLKEGTLKIGVYAYETDNDELVLRYSPSPATIHISSGSYVKEAQNSQIPTPTEIEQLETQIQSKQNTLVSGENIKTLNGNSILGEGNLVVAGAGDMEKRIYDTNDNGIVDNAEKVNNHTVECDVPANAVFTDTVFSGDYNDLSNKPSIPSKTSDLTNDSGYISSYTETDPTVPSHVKSISQGDIANWNNKSTFSGNYEDLTNKPTIPTVPTNVSSFTNDAGYLTSHQDISGKQDTLVSGTNIKTINNESILGSGNIEIQGGGTTYTAGTNIEITNENVINNKIPYNENFNGNGIYIGSGQVAYNRPQNTLNVVIGNNLQAGYNNGTVRNVIIGAQGGISTSSRSVENSVAIGASAYVNYSNSIVIGRGAQATKNNQAMFGSSVSPINKINIYTSNGVKEMATQDYVDTAIANAITNTLGGSF